MTDQAAEAPPAEDEASEHAEPEVVVQDATASPERDLRPLTFMGPHGTPPGVKDFRPITTLFKDADEDHPTEDGQGNLARHPSQEPVTPRHPSEPREAQPYNRRDAEEGSTEESGTPEDGGAGSKQGSPFQT